MSVYLADKAEVSSIDSNWRIVVSRDDTNLVRNLTLAGALTVFRTWTGSPTGHVVVGADAVEAVLRSNWSSASDPTVGDDTADGYGVGSVWTTTAGKVWQCTDATLGAAVWKDLTATTPPVGSGTEVQIRASATEFAALGGSSTANGGITLVSQLATARPLVLRGASGQSVNLQEWQDNSAAILSRVDTVGAFWAPYYNNLTGGSYVLWSAGSPNSSLQAANAAHVPLVVKGAASQSANLQEWRNSSGTAVAVVTASGNIVAGLSAITNPAGWTTLIQAAGSTYPGFSMRTSSGGNQQWDFGNNVSDLGFYDATAGAYRVNFYTPAAGKAVVFNEGGVDFDFRIEGDTNANLFFVDASADSVGVGTSTPSSYGAGYTGLTINASTAAYLDFKIGGSRNALFYTGSGEFRIFTDGNVPLVFEAEGYERLRLTDTTQTMLLTNAAAAVIGCVVKGAASQSANLQEWQNSAGTALASVSAGGAISSSLGISAGPVTFSVLNATTATATLGLYRITDRANKLAYPDGTNWRFVADDSIIS